MRYQNLGTFQLALETLSGGRRCTYDAECERQTLELHVYVLTHLDGLPVEK
jgi:hypothetical protein